MKFENGPLSGSVRGVTQDGTPYLVLSDVSPVLGIANTSNAVRQLRSTQYVAANAENRRALGVPAGRAPYLVTEGGFYRLALRSSRPEAIPFQEWVEDEVLPAIRRDGGYISEGATEEQIQEIADRAQARIDRVIEAANRRQKHTDHEVEIQQKTAQDELDSAWEKINFLEAYANYIREFTVHQSSRDAMNKTQFRKERWG